MEKGLIVHVLVSNNQNKFLIIKRSLSEGMFPGYWDLPGGTLEDGEDPARGAIRETKEETNLDIKTPRLFFQSSNVDKEKNKQFVTLIFSSCAIGGEVVLKQDEHTEYIWVQRTELEKYQTVPYLKACLMEYYSHGNKI